mgnify:CR=1 FL=1
MPSFGIEVEEIIGPKDSWTDENAWNDTNKNLESFRVDKITVNPDNTKSIQVITNDDTSYTIKGDSANKIFETLFGSFGISQYDSQDIKIPIW